MHNRPNPIRILAFWAPADFPEVFTPFFLNRPDFQMEVVSGDRSSGKCEYSAGPSRLADLKRRLRNKEFDLVIGNSIWHHPWPPHKQFFTRVANAIRFYTYKRRMLDTYWGIEFAKIARQVDVPFITIDLRDPTYLLPSDYQLLEEGFLYYKRELFYWPERGLNGKEIAGHAAKLRPMTYGVLEIPDKVIPWEEKNIDVFISGSMNPIRVDLVNRLRRFKSELRIEAHDRLISVADYSDMLRRSRMVLCVESFGCETWRMYQASVNGAVPFINWPYAQNAFQLEPDKTALYFSLIGDHFERELRKAFSDTERLRQIAAASRDYVIQYKTRSKVARWVVDNTLTEWDARKQTAR
jgi:hypothetical protein